MNPKKVWIVVEEYNDYDQHGSYFVAAFTQKPTFKKLKEVLGLSDVTTGKLTRGGGREGFQDPWYKLIEINEEEIYDEDKIYPITQESEQC